MARNFTSCWIRYVLLDNNGFCKLVSKTSVEHVIRDDYLNPEVKKQIDEFNDKLDKRLDDSKFILEGSPRFKDLDYDDDDHNHGVMANKGITPTDDEYGDMIINVVV